MPTASRRRPDPLDADLDRLSSAELEDSAFGPDPSRRRSAPRGATPRPAPRSAPRRQQTKFCHACAETLDARAEMCPACGVRQPGVGRPSSRSDRNTAVLLALASLFVGGVMLHKFYLDRTAAGVLSLVFFWTGIPWVVSLVNLVQYLRSDDATFAERYA